MHTFCGAMNLREANERRRLLSDERGNRMACPFTGPVIEYEVMGKQRGAKEARNRHKAFAMVAVGALGKWRTRSSL